MGLSSTLLKAMSNVFNTPGYWMDCYNGGHIYTDGVCKYCDRKLPTNTTTVIRYPYQTKGGPLAANE